MKTHSYAITPSRARRIKKALQEGLSKEAFLKELIEEDSSLLRRSIVLAQIEKFFMEQKKNANL
jgi:hypothetical protein